MILVSFHDHYQSGIHHIETQVDHMIIKDWGNKTEEKKSLQKSRCEKTQQ